MEKIYSYAASAFIASACLHCILILCARRISKEFWVFYYLGTLTVVCGLLCWQSVFPFHWLVPILLVTGTAVAAWQLKREWPPKKISLSHWDKFAVFFLVLDDLFAAFPFYRPDQWNYHLWIAKIISRLGHLPDVMFNDHVFFSGIYEYFFLIPRFISQDDIWNHCFSDVFTHQLFLVSMWGILSFLQKQTRLFLPNTGLILASILFALPAHPHSMNAKPDILLVPLACACLILIWVNFLSANKIYAGILGFFAVAGIAYKLTWLHFAGAVLLVVLIFGRRLKLNVFAVTAGACLGFGVTCAFYFKNIFYFTNPIHPVQVLWFKSNPWTLAMAQYWENVAQRAINGMDFAQKLVLAVSYLPSAFVYLTAMAMAFWLLCAKRRESTLNNIQALGRPFVLAVIFYICLWPLFYASTSYPRFYYPFAALLVILWLPALSISSKAMPRIAAMVLTLPVILNSSIDVHAKKIIYHSTQTAEEFFQSVKSNSREFFYDQIINEHRITNFPNATISEKTVLSSSNSHYFLDTPYLDLNSYEYDLLWQQTFTSGELGNMLSFIKKFDIRYLLLDDPSGDIWKEQNPAVMDVSLPLERGKKIYFIAY